MTFEQMTASLAEQGWDVWHLGQDTRGIWTCRLFNDDIGRRVIGRVGPTGYDLPCWKRGVGPTAVAAISAASPSMAKTQLPMEESLDLTKMLG